MMYEFDSAAAAEQASNEMYKVKHSDGTTELLYGHMVIDGKFVLQGVDERFQMVDGAWAWVENA